MNVYQSPVPVMEPVEMASIIIPVPAKVAFSEHAVKQMQMIASQILVCREGSYFYFSIIESQKVNLTHNI